MLKVNKDIEEQNDFINEQFIKVKELKGIVGKLTEVRAILNKYFNIHFDQFTDQEKLIIKRINDCQIPGNDQYNISRNKLMDTNSYKLGFLNDEYGDNFTKRTEKNFNMDKTNNNNYSNSNNLYSNTNNMYSNTNKNYSQRFVNSSRNIDIPYSSNNFKL